MAEGLRSGIGPEVRAFGWEASRAAAANRRAAGALGLGPSIFAL
jgi:hypothetical protein